MRECLTVLYPNTNAMCKVNTDYCHFILTLTVKVKTVTKYVGVDSTEDSYVAIS